MLRLGWVAALIVFLYPVRAVAAPAGWRPTPQITGEGVCALVAADGLVWAGGMSGGLYVSHDGGTSWRRRSIPESQLPACPLAVSPAYAGGHLLLGVTDRTYASTDGGVSWSPLPLPAVPSALAFSPSFATDGVIVAVTDAGPIYRSSDRGATWTKVANWKVGLPSAGQFIAYGATMLSDGSVWISTGDGVYRSLDGGTDWGWANSGLPTTQDVNPTTGTRFDRVQRVAAIASAGGTLVAALFATGRGWIYRSSDAGATWEKTGSTLRVRPTSLAIEANSTTWLLGTHEAGVLESADGGATWAPLGSDLGDEDISAVDALSSTEVLAGGSYDGVFRLNLSTRIWKAGFRGMPPGDAAGALTSTSRGALYAGAMSGVYRLAAGNWRPDNTGLPGERSTAGFATLGGPAGFTLFAATASGIYRRGGDGAWRQAGSRSMRGLATFSIAARGGPRGTMLAGTENGLFWSRDGGYSWRPYAVGDMYVSQLAFSPDYSRDHSIYALSNGRLERYHDRRRRVIRGYFGGAPILNFAVDPGTPRRILAATASGLYASTGSRWRRVVRAGLGPAPVIDFLTRRTVLLGWAGGLLLSHNAGRTWARERTPVGDGVLAIAPERPGQVAVSMANGGVWHFALP